MEKALTSSSWTGRPRGGQNQISPTISWPIIVSAGIWTSEGPAKAIDLQANIAEWIKLRHSIDLEPGQSTQLYRDDKRIVCASFRTNDDAFWSIRFRSGELSFDITAVAGKKKSEINVATRSDLLGKSPVDIFHFLCRRFIIEQDAVQLHDRPQLANVKNVPRLIEFIERSDRKLPVVVVSLDENERRIETAAVDPFLLSKRLIGVAHVIVVPGDETYALSTRFGKELSAYRGAIRVYGPGFLPDGPAAKLTARLLANESMTPEALLQNTCNTAMRLLANHSPSVGFDDVYSLDSQPCEVPQARSAHAANTIELLQRIAELEAALERRSASLQIAEARIAKLQKLQASGPESAAPQHRTALEVSEWAARELCDRLDIPKKAQKSTKGSSLKDLATLKQALMVLSDEYRTMRTSGGKENVQSLERVLAALHLEIAPVSPRVLDSARSKLAIEGPSGRLIADHHVRNKTNPHDPTKCIRIYFAWDEVRKIAVVASLPTYLG
jgi:hypothetical protein